MKNVRSNVTEVCSYDYDFLSEAAESWFLSTFPSSVQFNGVVQWRTCATLPFVQDKGRYLTFLLWKRGLIYQLIKSLVELLLLVPR